MIDEKEIFEHAQKKVVELTERLSTLSKELSKLQVERSKWANVLDAFSVNGSENTHHTPMYQDVHINGQPQPNGLKEQIIAILRDFKNPMSGKMIYAVLQSKYGYRSDYVSLSGKLRLMVNDSSITFHEINGLSKNVRYWYLLPEWVSGHRIVDGQHRLFIKNKIKEVQADE